MNRFLRIRKLAAASLLALLTITAVGATTPADAAVTSMRGGGDHWCC